MLSQSQQLHSHPDAFVFVLDSQTAFPPPNNSYPASLNIVHARSIATVLEGDGEVGWSASIGDE